MDKIEVTQDDKYAAASLMSDVGLFSNVLTAKAVQAFARHRLATRTDATPVAWMYQSHVGTYPRIHRKQQTERYKVGWTETPLYTHPPATDVAALVDALREAREALHFHYVEWDGEPDDAVPLQLARAKCDAALAPFTKGQNDA